MDPEDIGSLDLHESIAEVSDIVFVKDLAGRYLMANEAAAAVVGLTPEEMVGKLDVDMLPAAIAAQQREYDNEVLRRGQPITFEGPLVRDGEPRTVRTTKAPLQDADGKLIGIIGVAIDVSSMRSAEQALLRSEAELAEARELTAVGSWQWELASGRRYWSEQLYRIFGMDPDGEPLTWDQFVDFVHPDDRDRVRNGFEEAMATGSHYEGVNRIVRVDGAERLVACSATFERDLDGTVSRAIGCCHDITGRELSERLLREREQELNAAQELTGVGSWQWDLESNRVTWSDNLYRIFGLGRAEFGGTYEAYLAAVHPQDREARIAAIERVVASGKPTRDEHRIVRPDGEVRTIESTAMRTTDAAGRKWLIGACHDVTELRRAQQELSRRALLDPLTGLANRTLAFDRLAHALEVAARRGSTVAVIYLDVDGFKAINDAHGHAAGDQALREVGARIAGAVRHSDTLARLGGDEFLIICEDLETPEDSEEIAARVRDCCREDFVVEGRRRGLSLSVGTALAAGRRMTPEKLIAEADAAMYRDKRRRDSG